MLGGVRETAEWVVRTLERQAAIGEPAIARYRDASPRTTITDEAIRLVDSRLCCRSTDLVNARLTTSTGYSSAKRSGSSVSTAWWPRRSTSA